MTICFNITVGGSSVNEMTTPKVFHDVTTPTESLAGFIVSDLLQIAIFTKYVPSLIFPLGQYLEAYITVRFGVR